MKMLKYISILITIIIIACASAIKNEKKVISSNNEVYATEKIIWSSEQKLSWNDFKGKNENSFNYTKAETSTIIETVNTYYDNENLPIYEIACYFLPKKSWTITSEQFALKHEQLHFDIGELYTRKIRKAFDSLNINKVKDFRKYENIFNSLNEKCSYYNDSYDSEVYQTNEDNTLKFSFAKQKEWNDKIKKQLKVLDNYSQ